jgi:hypothetical protein
MRKLIYAASLALLFNTTPSWSQAYSSDSDSIHKNEPTKFSSEFSARAFVKFKNEREGYGDYKDQEKVQTEELYIIDGVKVIVTNHYVKNKEAQLDRKARREANDPRRMRYMEECISLTQDLNVCKELWEERQK